MSPLDTPYLSPKQTNSGYSPSPFQCHPRASLLARDTHPHNATQNVGKEDQLRSEWGHGDHQRPGHCRGL